VLKESSLSEVTKAIRQVSAGKRYLSESISQESIDSYLEKAKTTQSTPYDTLTSRERQILQMTAESQSGAEIGQKLFISPRTVEIHRQNAMRKLGLRNQTDLVRYAIKQGILPTT
jgi:DNA-binding NarL/FixJ family response regulator